MSGFFCIFENPKGVVVLVTKTGLVWYFDRFFICYSLFGAVTSFVLVFFIDLHRTPYFQIKSLKAEANRNELSLKNDLMSLSDDCVQKSRDIEALQVLLLLALDCILAIVLQRVKSY